MATTAGISLEQFLATHFDPPEPDYVDGEIVERSMPDWTHSRLQGILWGILSQAVGLAVATELRVRLATGKAYIIDVCAYPADQQMSRFPSTPPIVAAEILSVDDVVMELNLKLENYRKWGVPHIWLIDPWFPQLNKYDDQGLHRVSALEIPEFGIRITLEELMAAV